MPTWEATFLEELKRIQQEQIKVEKQLACLNDRQAYVADTLSGVQQDLAGVRSLLTQGGTPAAAETALAAPRECHAQKSVEDLELAPHEQTVDSEGGSVVLDVSEMHSHRTMRTVGSKPTLGGMLTLPSSSWRRQVGSKPTLRGMLALPSSWPATLRLRSSFSEAVSSRDGVCSTFQGATEFLRRNVENLHSVTSSAGVSAALNLQPKRKYSLNNWVMKPSCLQRMLLDISTMAMLLVDLAITPVMMAWGLEAVGVFFIISWATLIFWTVEIFSNFFSGYYRGGQLEMNFWEVAKHYLRTTFVLDVLVLFVDWFAMVDDYLGVGDNAFSDVMRTLRLNKLGRALRITRLLRMGRLPDLFERMADRNSLWSSWSAALEVMKIVFIIVWLNHLICCLWFAVGNHATTDTGLHWLDYEVAPGAIDTLREAQMTYQYAVAFHWSLTQMTPGSMKVQPLNSWETFFNICCLLFGLLCFSTLVSLLSSKMMRWTVMRQDQHRKMVQLQRFLRQANVSPALAVSIQKQVVNQMSVRTPVIPSDVGVLKLLPLSLQMELQWELCKPSLFSHGLFRFWAAVDPFSLKQVCHNAIVTQVLHKDDNLFLAGAKAIGAFNVVRGSLRYVQVPESSMVTTEVIKEVKVGAWLCEAALFSNWNHVGTVEAAEISELLFISAEAFVEGLMGQHLLMHFSVEYAKNYHVRLLAASPPKALWPTDLGCPFTDYADIIVAMSPPMREVVGMVALEIMLKGKWFWGGRKALLELQEEVRSGSSTILQTAAGEVRRVVAVSALRLVRGDGRMLAQLGKLEADGMLAFCTLPGAKQGQGEAPIEVMQRLMDTSLSFVAGGTTFTGVEQIVEVKDSTTYRIRTLYTRTIHSASFEDSFPVTGVLEARAPADVASTWTSRDCTKSLGLPTLPPTQTVYVVGTNPGKYFAWLTPEEFQHYSSQAGEKDLERWLGALSKPFPLACVRTEKELTGSEPLHHDSGSERSAIEI